MGEIESHIPAIRYLLSVDPVTQRLPLWRRWNAVARCSAAYVPWPCWSTLAAPVLVVADLHWIEPQQRRVAERADRSVTAAQRTLALATAGGDAVLHALANQRLGIVFQAQGDYRGAINCLGQTMALFDGEWRHERFGQITLPAVLACAHLAMCHAELGMFAEGRALGEEGSGLPKW